MTAQVEGSALGVDDLAELATEAFFYGFPLVFDLQEIERFTRAGMGSLAPAPMNVFSHAVALAGPQDTFVSINNDTVYSIANVDTAGGPVRLDVPDAAGRYYVLQFVDAWTNNFAYVGRRATGTAARSFLLVGPEWDDEQPDDTTLIRFPTAVASIVGRWAVDGEADLPAVRELQARAAADAERRGGRAARARSGGATDRVLRAPARVAAGLSAGGPRPPLPAALRPAGAVRGGLALHRSGLPTRGRAQSRARGGAGATGGRAQGRPRPAAERVGPDVPPVRLQPGLLRGRCARPGPRGSCPTTRSATSCARWRRAPGSGATTATRPRTR